MQSPYHCFITLILCTLVPELGTLAQNSTAPKPVIPLGPKELLSYLPAPANGWKVTESTAKNSFSEWLISDAVREYSGPTVAPPTPGSPPVVPITKLTLRDTGFFPSFNAQFANFSPGKSDGTESFMLEGYPAVKFTYDGSEVVQVWVAQRFIVTIELKYQEPALAKEWLKQVNLAKLKSIPPEGNHALSEPLTMHTLDELDPKHNNTYTLEWTSAAEAAEANKVTD